MIVDCHIFMGRWSRVKIKIIESEASVTVCKKDIEESTATRGAEYRVRR